MTHALVAQWIEHQLAELGVGGSSPLERAIFSVYFANNRYPLGVYSVVGMKTHSRINFDKLGAWAGAICAVHCLLTGVALGLLSYAGIGFLGSVATDAIFLGVALIVGIVAVVHGMRKHHSYKPAMVFVLGLIFIVLGHFAFRHVHGVPPTGWDLERVLSVAFSVAGGLCLVGFHVLNLRLAHRCSCSHCRTGH